MDEIKMMTKVTTMMNIMSMMTRAMMKKMVMMMVRVWVLDSRGRCGGATKLVLTVSPFQTLYLQWQ